MERDDNLDEKQKFESEIQLFYEASRSIPPDASRRYQIRRLRPVTMRLYMIRTGISDRLTAAIKPHLHGSQRPVLRSRLRDRQMGIEIPQKRIRHERFVDQLGANIEQTRASFRRWVRKRKRRPSSRRHVDLSALQSERLN